jgi:hypothetical protein
VRISEILLDHGAPIQAKTKVCTSFLWGASSRQGSRLDRTGIVPISLKIEIPVQLNTILCATYRDACHTGYTNYYLYQGWQTFYSKTQVLNTFWLCRSWSAAMIKLCQWSRKAAMANMQTSGRVPIKLYLQTQWWARFGPQAVIYLLLF